MTFTDSPFTTHALRRRALNDAPVRPDGDFVLYWMTSARRSEDNFALDHAIEWARALDRPLLVLEALRAGYPFACDRFHDFILAGMRDQILAFDDSAVTYRAYVEPWPGAGRGLLAALAARACVVIGDDYPTFFLPRMLAAAGARLPVRFEVIDGHGLVPLRAPGKECLTAALFRRHVQRWVPAHPDDAPAPAPLADLRLPLLPAALLPERLSDRWAFGVPSDLSALPIDHTIAPTRLAGGARSARARLEAFATEGLAGYVENRNHPDADAPSRLSAALHFGHLSPHRIFRRLTDAADWHPGRIDPRAMGKREGFWGLPAATEAFLDQLLVWRELGANVCHHRPTTGDADLWATLPAWARDTLDRHAADPRRFSYELAAFEAARTHDPLWNAAQRQLVREGYIHNYLRMLWGKKILEWSASPREALRIMRVLNDRYALDGRDPNSECGIAWVLGRHDHPWPPERPVFGTVRYMSSENTARKVRLRAYLQRYGT
jgi:deoxyribodipyrimidine photo-lyase